MLSKRIEGSTVEAFVKHAKVCIPEAQTSKRLETNGMPLTCKVNGTCDNKCLTSRDDALLLVDADTHAGGWGRGAQLWRNVHPKNAIRLIASWWNAQRKSHNHEHGWDQRSPWWVFNNILWPSYEDEIKLVASQGSSEQIADPVPQITFEEIGITSEERRQCGLDIDRFKELYLRLMSDHVVTIDTATIKTLSNQLMRVGVTTDAYVSTLINDTLS